MTNFFDSKPESSSDIKLTDDDGYLKNPVTGGNTWFHSSSGHDTVFSDSYLDHVSGHVGTYHTADPDETLNNGYLHSNKIKMSHPLVVSDHHDIGNWNTGKKDDLERGQFHNIASLVKHYALKYGHELFPHIPNPNEPGAEEEFYRSQNERNENKINAWKKQCDELTAGRKSDPWHVECSEPNCRTCNYLPPRPEIEKDKFSTNYLENFKPSDRLCVLRYGAMKEGYDGFVFHYNSKNPTIFVLKPSSQIESHKIVKENTASETELKKNNPVVNEDTGLQQFIRKNDLFEAEKARGAEKRAS